MSAHPVSTYAAALILTAIAVTPVSAADLGGNCCADLEERIAELEATTARKGNRKVSLTISGMINETLMFWDDGFERNTYQLTNETKRGRFKFAGNAKITDDWSAGYVLELGPRGARQDRASQTTDTGSGSNTVDIRYSYWTVKSKSLGTLGMGLQPQASDGVTEVTTANTDHFARPAPTQQFGDSGGGFFLRLNDGTLTSLRFGNIVTQGFNGTPGEGHRLNAVRYDTPTMAGFTASASWGEDDFWDLALRYAGELGGFKLAAAIGYVDWTDGSATNPRGCARATTGSDVDCQEIGLSGSIMHLATGLFVTGGYGHRKDHSLANVYAGAAGIDDTQDFYFVQSGIEQKWLSIGKTTIFGEYWRENAGPGLTTNGTQLNAAPLGAGARVSAAEITMWGVGLNQTVAEGVDMYVSYRHVDADVFTSATGGRTGETKVEIEPFQYVTAGAAIKF